MNQAVTAYITAVKKHMPCTGKAKQELTAGLLEKMTQCAEETDSVDMTLLCQNFGPPKVMALELMQDVTPAQQKAYRNQKYFLRVVAGVLAAIFLAFVGYVFFDKQKPIIAQEETIDDGIVFSDITSDK